MNGPETMSPSLPLSSVMTTHIHAKLTNGLKSMICGALFVSALAVVNGQVNEPRLVDPNLGVRPITTNLDQPTSMAFLGPDDLLVLEKATGKVQRILNGQAPTTVLDLAVNSGSERGLLGIALHPDFPANPGVYLYWTETLSNADTTVLADTPLLGNRVDRFLWDGSTLTFEANLIHLHASQADAGQTLRGNHNG